MKKILFLNPAISSINLGDDIIEQGCKTQLDKYINKYFKINISTHLPIDNYYFNFINDVDYTFVLGSNLLMPKLNRKFRQWNIKMSNTKVLNNVILMGVGWQRYSKKTNFYTKRLYKKVLSSKYLHSVRDEYTKEELRKIGITNVINTGCPTLWGLTPEHCDKIPQKKAQNVVFTITDYNRDIDKDKYMIEVLKKNYQNIYFWPQGSDDMEYYLKLCNNDSNIIVLDPNLESYDKLLKTNNDLDFVGTRLHGGIMAMQNYKRTMIISIDNRAYEMHKKFNIPILERDNIEKLDSMLNSDYKTVINLPTENIRKWLSQFDFYDAK